MHYCDMVVESIRMKDLECMKKVIGVYMEELKRDGNFIEYQDRIAQYYFNGKIKQPNMMQQMMSNMMNQGGANPNMMIGGK